MRLAKSSCPSVHFDYAYTHGARKFLFVIYFYFHETIFVFLVFFILFCGRALDLSLEIETIHVLVEPENNKKKI